MLEREKENQNMGTVVCRSRSTGMVVWRNMGTVVCRSRSTGTVGKAHRDDGVEEHGYGGVQEHGQGGVEEHGHGGVEEHEHGHGGRQRG